MNFEILRCESSGCLIRRTIEVFFWLLVSIPHSDKQPQNGRGDCVSSQPAQASACLAANTRGSARLNCVSSAATNYDGLSTTLRRAFAGLTIRLAGSTHQVMAHSPQVKITCSDGLPGHRIYMARRPLAISFNPIKCHQILELILTTLI